jgi:hypothetical protein
LPSAGSVLKRFSLRKILVIAARRRPYITPLGNRSKEEVWMSLSASGYKHCQHDLADH